MVESALVLALLAATINKLVDFTKYIKNKDTNGALTQIYVWAVGVVGVIVFVKSGLLDGVVLPYSDAPIDSYGTIAQALIGFSAASVGSVVGVDFRKAIDNTDSAATESLF